MELTKTDVRVLRTLADLDGGIARWGAGVSESIGFLRGAGYITRGDLVQITDAGRAALQAQEQTDGR
jgi:hypothetical protein